MLDNIKSPEDLKALSYNQLEDLSGEIRKYLIEQVSKSGGHLGPNLGVVELTIAIHRVFESPKDRTVVCVVGDGALTGGMSWEALNNIAASKNEKLVIIVNDNERSYSPTIGGVATYLSTLRATSGYERFLDWGKGVLEKTPVVGQPIYETLHGVKKGIKDIVAPQGMFEDLGLKYFGPVDGHNIEAVEKALKIAKDYDAPVLVHVITEKGKGYAPAIQDEAEKFHAVGVVDPETGVPLAKGGKSWTSVFSDELVKIGSERKDVVALTAAMMGPTGLDKFQKSFPYRTFDVGIAEQHATTAAAGMAYAGLHPVFAVYSTFLNRAFDQLLLDVALHKAGVTFVLDRAGITGDDGPSHNGIWDLALTGIVPTLHVAAPRDGQQLRETLREALDISDAPSLIRFPKGVVNPDIPAFERRDGVDVLYRGESADILLVSIGAFAAIAVEAAGQAYREGVGVTVIDPRWVKPLPESLVTMAQRYKSVVVLEDGIKHGGIASTISELFRESQLNVPVHSIGVPLTFLEHAKRNEILEDLGITVQNITRSLVAWSSSDFGVDIKEEMQHPLDENEYRKPLR